MADSLMLDSYMMTVSLGLLGLLLGSFSGVVIHRGPIIWGLVETPEGAPPISLALPRSHCPACQSQLSTVELIPILGFVMARGKCRSCQIPIPTFYPVVETLGLISGLTAALLFEGLWATGLALGFFLLLIPLAVIDKRTGYLPDALTLPLATIGLAAGGLNIFVSPEHAIFGWVLGWGSLAVLAGLYRMVRGREGLGGGDAKLLGAGATFTGPAALPLILLIAAASALVSVMITQRGQTDGATEIRFGPWLAGAIALVFVVRTIWPGLLP